MIITRTPLRISLAGGGSDLPAYFQQEGRGQVVGAAIARYVHVAVNQQYEGRVLAHYRSTEWVDSIDQLKHDRMRETLRYYGLYRGIEVTSLADVPGNSGLGSSSAFTVGLAAALGLRHGFQQTRRQLAETACHIEIDICKAPIGLQDQYLAALGGLNHLIFHDTMRVMAEAVDLPRGSQLSEHLMLVEVSTGREASGVLREVSQDMTPARRKQIRRLVDYVTPALRVLARDDFQGLGDLLHETWMIKKELTASISSSPIDDLYVRAREAGAWGGKLCGAGGGGFLLLVAPSELHDHLGRILGARTLPVRFDYTGTHLIYHEGEER